ncbi:MAG: dipeptidase PepV [Fusicatenibacter sp.]|nr:dipeptidase PepV [Fusicatenibacter sp.]
MEFRKLVEKRQEELIADLARCVQIPSVYAQDQSGLPYGKAVDECLDYMLSRAEAMGFSVCNMDHQLGWCEYGSGDEMVAVLAHLDVVPEGDGWTVPPYEGRVIDGRIYGRGTMDDKGPAVAALYGLLALKEAGIVPRRRIRLIFGLNEETGSADMKYYLSHGGEVPVMGITPDGEYPVINGEKGLVTQEFSCSMNQSGEILLADLAGGTAHNIVPAQASARLICQKKTAQEIAERTAEKITCTLTEDGIRIEADGIGAHGGSPQEGENAIGRLLLFLNQLPLEGDLSRAVRFLAEKIGMEYDGKSLGIAMEDEVSGPLTVNLGVIRGDSEQITVKLNYRYPVTYRFDACGPVVNAAFLQAGFHETFLSHKAGIYMAPESDLVSKLLKVYSDYTGEEAKPKCIGGGTYAKMIPNTLAFGPIFPGDEVREHKPDEYMEIDRLLDNAAILAAAMNELAD